MSDNPKNDNPIEGLDSDFSTSGNVITMKCNGPTSFSVGKNARGFDQSIGGCGMDFGATAKRGYSYKADDVRDIEYKCWMRIPSNLSSGHDGFSMSVCTGRHTSSNCCQGFAYMGSLEGVNSNPTQFRFRKETLHVQYTDSSEGTWTHPKCNFKLSGHGWFGFGFCRYNKPSSGGTSPQDDHVILEIWFNPDPTNSPDDWTMLKRTEDKPGRGWTGSKGKCHGDNDQIGVWSGAHNRLKSNSTSGTIQFTNISFREIDAFGTFEEPGGGGPGSSVQRWIKYAMVSGDNTIYPHYTLVTGHEIAETLTDPDPLNTFGGQAWGNSAGREVSDPCEDIFMEYADGLDIEPYWSNSDDRCVIPGLTVPDTVEVPSMTNRKGGDVLANGKIYLIYWGLDWSTRVASPVAATLTNLIQNQMLGTDVTYFSKLTQYGVSAPTWGGAAFNTTFPVPSHSAITETEGRACIVDTFNKGFLPIPTDTNENVYVLYVPVGKDITPLGSLSTPGGFHDIWHPSLTPPPTACPTGFHRNSAGACIPDTVTCPTGQHEDINGICIPDDTGGGGGVNEPHRVQGFLRLLWDINTLRGGGACQGTGGGGGGGSGTLNKIYEVLAVNEKGLSNSTTFNHRTKLIQTVNSESSGLIGQVIKQLDVPLKKEGTPIATDGIRAKIWSFSGGVLYTSPTILDPTTLTTSFVNYTFDFTANVHTTHKNNKIGIEYLGKSDTNHIFGAFDDDVIDGSYMQNYESTTYDPHTDRDMSMTLWA